jgi:hypothetical protein
MRGRELGGGNGTRGERKLPKLIITGYSELYTCTLASAIPFPNLLDVLMEYTVMTRTALLTLRRFARERDSEESSDPIEGKVG